MGDFLFRMDRGNGWSASNRARMVKNASEGHGSRLICDRHNNVWTRMGETIRTVPFQNSNDSGALLLSWVRMYFMVLDFLCCLEFVLMVVIRCEVGLY